MALNREVQLDECDMSGSEDEGAAADMPVDSSDDEPDDTVQVVDTVGAAPMEPPTGVKFASGPPPLATDEDMLALVGNYILHAFDAPQINGWFLGRISSRGVSQRDLKQTPTANMVVTYDKKLTKNPHLHGRVASTLTLNKYGSKEWWVLLERV